MNADPVGAERKVPSRKSLLGIVFREPLGELLGNVAGIQQAQVHI